MKATKLFILIGTLLFSGLSSAELITPVVLTPSNTSFSASAEFDPTYPARTYPDDHDVWTFDLSAFDPNFLVSTDLSLGDYCCYADNYDLYWDGSFLGNTGVGTVGSFSFDVTAGIHTLEVDWLNPIAGGSWYNISIDVASGPAVVPEPSTYLLFGIGLLGLIGISRKRKSA